MNYRDAEKLAEESWDAVSDLPFVLTTVDHQLRLVSLVNILEEQLAKSHTFTSTGSAGMEEFEAEVVRRMTALAPVLKELEPEVVGKGKSTAKKK